jgi:hypothetical protein
MTQQNKERIFSYGTLQYEAVQLANFGRKLTGNEDALPGFTLSMIEITDPDVVATSGEAFHPIVSWTGNPTDLVNGMVFEISEEELQRADSYEVADYKRIKVTLASGITAWVYVHKATAMLQSV